MRTVAHSNACRFRSSRLANWRPGKKFVSTVQKLRSSPALRFGVTFLVANKLKPVLAGELRHLRHHHGIGSGARQTSQAGVVDNADLGGIAPEPEGFM